MLDVLLAYILYALLAAGWTFVAFGLLFAKEFVAIVYRTLTGQNAKRDDQFGLSTVPTVLFHNLKLLVFSGGMGVGCIWLSQLMFG